MKLAKKLLTRGTLAQGFALEAVLRGTDLPMADGMTIEADLFGTLAASEDRKEGLTAFLEKRKPSWQIKGST